MFVNTIISSIPDTFQPTINALVVVHSHAKEKLQPPKLIAAIRAKALSYVKKGEQKKESAHYARSSNRGRRSFQGCGNSCRGRPRGKGRSGGSSCTESNCYNCSGRGHWGNECPLPKQTQANQAKEQKPSSKEHRGNKCNKSDGNWRDRLKTKEVASSSMIEEVPESSWAAVEVPSKKGNLVFDFSDFQIENNAEEGVRNDVEELADNIEQDVDLTTQDHANATANSHGAILFDSGCSTHMTPLGDLLRNQKGIPTQAIQAANGESSSGKLLKDQAIPGMPRHSKGCPGIWPIPRQY